MKKLVASLAVAVLTVGVAATSVSAQEHEVEKGDNLWNIANDYNTTVDELVNINELNNTIIHPKQILNVDEEKQTEETKSEAPAEKSDDNAEKASEEKQAADDESKEKKNDENQSESPEGKTVSANATAYTAHCEGCSGVTATGVDLNADPDAKVIAVDPDVIPLGSKVYVEGYGYATADDTGGDIKGDRIDLHVPSKDEAFDFGRQSVDVTIVE